MIFNCAAFQFILYICLSNWVTVINVNAIVSVPTSSITPKKHSTRCPEGYVKIKTSTEYPTCVFYHKKPLPLVEAHKRCMADNGFLARTGDDVMDKDKIEIALRESNGSCVKLWDIDFYWTVHTSSFGHSCDDKNQTALPFFCEIFPFFSCHNVRQREGWRKFDFYCFKIIYNKEGMTFSEAREACQAVGSRPDLVVLDQWGRNELMKDMIAQECVWENEGSENSTDDNAWIGLRIFNGTEFAWTFQLGEGEDNHIHDSFVGNEANRGKFPWAATEPKRVNNVEACVSLNVREGAVWSVTNCDRKLRTAVCQDQY